MKIDARLAPATDQPGPRNAHLLLMGLDGLRKFQDRTDNLLTMLETLQEAGHDPAPKLAGRLIAQLNAMEASVTMIGQVKAGKTSLVNAMVGWPDLLPADVNPWTSVVTSLHMRPDAYPEGNHATFEFFDQAEWDRLMERGGRVGELASRTGAAEEMEKIRRQIAEMREKSRKRLGRKFELLLGQQHKYGYFDSELVERYVCLGDDFADDIAPDGNQGRFADITKSADLYLHRPEIPVPLCIRDTPGVNDTFMMREQITIRAIRESRICVVVLSAHQALSAVDMALIRLISNVKSREVIIFVNRIDELADPAAQVPEIRAAIEKTLKAHHGPEGAQIIFGSAYWANCALTGRMDDMDRASAAALVNWAEAELQFDTGAISVEEMVWELSGVPELYGAIAERIEEGVGQETLNRIARRAVNLAQSAKATSAFSLDPEQAGKGCQLDEAEIARRLGDIEQACTSTLDAAFARHLEDFHKRLDRAHRSFLDRATAALVTHLETYGDEAVWSYDPTGLRMLLRTAYQVFGKNAQSATETALQRAAEDLATLYRDCFGDMASELSIRTPEPPRIAPPVLLGQTIALDLKGNWWTRWWQRRRGYRAYAMEFAEMIQAETDPIITGLKQSHCHEAVEDAKALLHEFLTDQRAILQSLAEQARSGVVDDETRARAERRALLDETLAALRQHAA